AQWGERASDTREAAGSTPAGTMRASVAQPEQSASIRSSRALVRVQPGALVGDSTGGSFHTRLWWNRQTRGVQNAVLWRPGSSPGRRMHTHATVARTERWRHERARDLRNARRQDARAAARRGEPRGARRAHG